MSMNQINVIGRLTRDPESRAAGGSTVVTFPLAAPTSIRSTAAGENSGSEGNTASYLTNFFRVEIWGKRGDYVMRYIKQGDQIALSGELLLRKYKTAQGLDAWSFDIQATSVTLLRKKGAAAVPADSRIPS